MPRQCGRQRGRGLGELQQGANKGALDLCRDKANPTTGDWKKLNTLGRCLLGVPRVVSEFRFQGGCEEITAYSD